MKAISFLTIHFLFFKTMQILFSILNIDINIFIEYKIN